MIYSIIVVKLYKQYKQIANAHCVFYSNGLELSFYWKIMFYLFLTYVASIAIEVHDSFAPFLKKEKK